MTAPPTIASLGEFGLIRQVLMGGRSDPSVALGIGDDAALLTPPPGHQLLTTVDALLSGVHFTPDVDPQSLAHKALAVNLSDIAAMGGEPRWYFLSLSLPPDTPLDWMERFAAGLRAAEERYGVTLAGGDTTASRAGVVLSVTLLGVIPAGEVLTRAGAQPGELIVVSGTLGDSWLGLQHILGQRPLPPGADRDHLLGRHLCPEPRLALGRGLAREGLAGAAMDISDGLLGDLGHICRASGVGARVALERLPLSPAARGFGADAAGALALAAGGEDYELLFTVAPPRLAAVTALAQRCRVPVAVIGEVVAGAPQVVATWAGRAVSAPEGGWRHF